MALEERRGRLYYYRKERSGGSVRSVYVGVGTWAKAAAELDAGERRERKQKREARRARAQQQSEEDRTFDSLAALCEEIAAAHLLALGFHAHKRQWRLIRGGKA